jgi:hypothetical protein
VDEEVSQRLKIYTKWLQEFANELPERVTVVRRPASRAALFRWAIYRDGGFERPRLLHPDSAFLAGLPPAEARQFLHQALKIKLM